MVWFNAVLGLVLLLFGRSLYWAFVAIAGFLLAWQFTEVALVDQPMIVRLLAALAAGIVGALLALVAQRLAFAIGGAYAGAYLALSVGQSLSPETAPALWMVVGGIVGAVVAALLMDWAIIILSSLVGAGAIVTSLPLQQPISTVVFLVLLAIGIGVQAGRMRRAQGLEEAPPT